MDKPELLDALQYGFPLVARPFAALAHRLGETEETVMADTRKLVEERVIRSIRGFFDAARLSHRSALVAAHVPEDRLSAVARHVSAHPGVSHNYAREHHFNLWFTITTPDSIDLHSTVARLLSDVDEVLLLPALRLFKIDARFAMGEARMGLEPEPLRTHEATDRFEPDQTNRTAIYALNQQLPVAKSAFAELAERFHLTEDVLLGCAKAYLEQGIMRRFGAVLNHRRAGFAANGMTGWIVPAHQVEAVGHLFTGVPEVSHCYERVTYPNWPYNVFTMIHGQTREAVLQVVRRMAAMARIDDWVILYSTIEFKKSAVSYFDPAMYDEPATVGENSL